ncbi:hypothetical protein HHI36_016959 [Cryptolaemus montrouzieri]|uniref:Uncharacterized protein n=1 Tax=Cryptolaemus montrouzieri TaxID=559131 RepID=A0ABD2NL89_9CUCU
MSQICQTCTSAIKQKTASVRCSGACGLAFHANGTCADINKDQLAMINKLPGGNWTWICMKCRGGGAAPPSSRNRQGSVSVVEDATQNSTTPNNNAFVALKNEIKLLRESVTFCSDKVSDFEALLVDFKDYMKVTDKLVSENKSQVADLNSRLNTIEQYSRSNNLEIQGVTEKNNENLLNVVCTIAQHLDFNISESMIDYVHRVPTRKENGTKNIIVRFQNRRTKEDMLAAAKTKGFLKWQISWSTG